MLRSGVIINSIHTNCIIVFSAMTLGLFIAISIDFRFMHLFILYVMCVSVCCRFLCEQPGMDDQQSSTRPQTGEYKHEQETR